MEEILSYTCQVLKNIQFLHFNEGISFRMRKEPSNGKMKRPRGHEEERIPKSIFVKYCPYGRKRSCNELAKLEHEKIASNLGWEGRIMRAYGLGH